MSNFCPYFFNLKAQSFINGDNVVCANSVLNYSVGGVLGGCGSITYSVSGGVFPDHSDATTKTLNTTSINVKWSGTTGSITASGCSSTASKNVTVPPVPNVYTVESFSPIPCGSTANFDIYVLVNIPPPGVSLTSAPNGPQSFSLLLDFK